MSFFSKRRRSEPRVDSRTSKPRRRPLAIDLLEDRMTPSTVTTSQADYAPGSVATFNGHDFLAGETVQFHVAHTDLIYQNQYAPWDVTDGNQTPAYTDAHGVLHLPDLDGVVDGNVQTTWQVGQIPGSTLQLTATGLTSGDVATTTFTDTATFNSFTVNGPQSATLTYGTGGSTNFDLACGFSGSGANSVGFAISWTTDPGVTVGFSPTTVSTTVSGTQHSTLQFTTSGTTQAGTYGFTITATSTNGGGPFNSTGTLTIDKKALQITANSTSKTYGTAVTFAGTEFSSSGLVNSDSVTSVSLSSSGAAATATVAGSPYTITPSSAVGSGLSNYTTSYVNGSLTVNRKDLTVTANSTTKIYGDTVTFAGTEFTTSGLVNSDTVTSVTLSSSGAAATATVAGSAYAITPSAAVGTGLANYQLTYTSGNLTVTPKDLTITANSTTKIYGVTVTYTGTEFTSSGLVNSDTVTSVTLSSVGAAPGATINGSPYAITPSAAVGTGLDNYTITYANGSLTVTPKDLTITANARSKIYGQTVSFSGAEFTASGLVNGNSVSSVILTSTGAAATATVGSSPYTIVPSAAAGSGINNYTITYVNGSLTVTPKALTITAKSTSKAYGQTLTFAGTEFTANGLANTDTVTSVTLTSAGAAAGATVAGSPYAITASAAVGTGLANYSITYASGSLTVTSKALTITANSTSKTYGQTVTFAGTEFTASGLGNGDTISSVTLTSTGAAATASTTGSPYAIVPSAAVGTNLANYTITYVNGSLSVAAKALTITANSTSKTYGQTVNFAGTEFTTSGLVNGNTVTSVTLTSTGAAASATVAGSPYAIVPSAALGTGLGNYTITYVNGSLSVGTKALTVTANSTSKTYGQSLTFGGTEFTAPGLVNGNTITSVTLTSAGAAATATVAGSPYAIVPSAAVGTGLANYTISYASGSLTVVAKALTITANSTSKVYGQTVTFNGTQFTSSGLANSDTVTSVTLTSTGAAATATVAGSPYAIVPSAAVGSGLVNYTISYVNGSLSVTPKSVTVIGITALDKDYDGTTAATLDTSGAAVNGAINGDVVTPNTSAAVGNFVDANVGNGKTVNITGVGLSGAAASNYALASQPTTTADILPAGSIVVAGTSGNDTLVLTGSPGNGAITYTLNGDTPVVLTGVTLFIFNGGAGDDAMTVTMPATGTLSTDTITLDGGSGNNSLTLDAAGRYVRVATGFLDVGSIYAPVQRIAASNIASRVINNTSGANAFYGPDTADRSTALTGLTPQQRVVQVLYLNALGRAGTVSELNGWLPTLSGPNGQQNVATGIESSLEARTHLVKTWYLNYLNRPAVGGEEQFLVGRLTSGQSEEATLGLLLGSSEFFNNAQTLTTTGTPQQRYVQTLYQTLLQRAASAGELSFWVGQLTSLGNSGVAQRLLESTEFRTNQVEAYYEILLHRAGDAGGAAFWAQSKKNLMQLRIGFDSSPEFFSNG